MISRVWSIYLFFFVCVFLTFIIQIAALEADAAAATQRLDARERALLEREAKAVTDESKRHVTIDTNNIVHYISLIFDPFVFVFAVH